LTASLKQSPLSAKIKKPGAGRNDGASRPSWLYCLWVYSFYDSIISGTISYCAVKEFVYRTDDGLSRVMEKNTGKDFFGHDDRPVFTPFTERQKK
jgi:hypothetical protein